VSLLFTVRGVSDLEAFDEAAVAKRYGVPPSAYVDFATLRGDPSDGLPGVSGIGPKRAAALIARYGSLRSVLEHVDDLPEKTAAALRGASGYLEAMEKVVPPVGDARIDMTPLHEPDEAELGALAERYNLGSSAARLAQARKGKR
jgi:hypothetical protein